MADLKNIDIGATIRSFFKADRLIQNMPFLILVAVLGIFYIANAHYHLQLERKIDQKEAEVKKMSWKYMTIKSEVMYDSKQSEVAKAVSSIGLKPLTEPPKVIEVNK